MQEPAWTFIEELQKPLHQQKPVFWQDRPAGAGEVSLAAGIRLEFNFPDPAELLHTALADFGRFCQILDLIPVQSGPGLPLFISQEETDCFEAYSISIRADGIYLAAADTEGIRRGLVHLEELIQASGAPVLACQEIRQKPFIRTRLSRCFFGPIKRPPMNRDELEDEINYYPDEYLNRLAHEGVNALWLTISFRDTVPVQVLPGFGKRAHIHLPKLRQTVARCARYGIRVFAFFIEPTAFINEREHNRYLDLKLYEKEYPELIGNKMDNVAAFCPDSDLARQFLYQAAYNLFKAVPGLGGMLDISVGERITHCASWYADQNNCPRCSKKEPALVLAGVLERFYQGMIDANPQAEFISWPYSQYLLWGKEGTVAAAGQLPPGVVLQHNFESSGLALQLGKVRRADDYWLSYTGPSDLYRQTADQARAKQTPIYAKLQVGCSHEVASVTHVPVPGILFDKYEKMLEMGVSGAMQSWYFGNYPSLMTRAAGRLSFLPWSEEKEDFLARLAQPDWGPYSKQVIRAWALFQKAYQHYPIYHVFGYYAPVHDGPVWPLYLRPANLPLIANWKFMPEFPVHGDRIGECLQDAFSLEEAILLCSRMQRIWQEGLAEISGLAEVFQTDIARLRDLNTARALGILFDSCLNILRFYQLREKMADLTGQPALACLSQLKDLVKLEQKNSLDLAECCQLDPALGFNSEHEGFRFYPEKLLARHQQLEELLQNDFVLIKARLQANEIAFPSYTGQVPDRASYMCQLKNGTFSWATIDQEQIISSTGQLAGSFQAVHDKAGLILKVSLAGPLRPLALRFFAQRLWPERTYLYDPATGQTSLQVLDQLRPPLIEGHMATVADKTTNSIVFYLPFAELERGPAQRYNPLRFNLLLAGPEGSLTKDLTGWQKKDQIGFRLAQSPVNPDEYGWLCFET